ncbi:hypothetical protein SAMN04487996_102247 [Dyadobacter soli]|uniref:Uncharacterized protein n=1 Tax=Dyadobacter soli TaxID=659014 RepID=A0A1G6XTC7_9BACT|nr:hypothetical protein [Dyadobacter soli]SDD81231.1 hypothetical protein SAMN04487996_102247 [Dyadobacter soli]
MGNPKKENFSQILDKIVAGVNKAVKKMVEESALRDESVVIGEKNGQARRVPAKELLKSLDSDK